jgi:hypothetical protein
MRKQKHQGPPIHAAGGTKMKNGGTFVPPFQTADKVLAFGGDFVIL